MVREEIFHDDRDRSKFLGYLKEGAELVFWLGTTFGGSRTGGKGQVKYWRIRFYSDTLVYCVVRSWEMDSSRGPFAGIYFPDASLIPKRAATRRAVSRRRAASISPERCAFAKTQGGALSGVPLWKGGSGA
jgi:hypothetical protein